MRMISATPTEWKKFKRRYEKALADKEEQFTFKFASEPGPSDFLTAYAGYLIEYMKGRIPE